MTGIPLFLTFDAQGRHLSQDCRHRHDERRTGAKKKDDKSEVRLLKPGSTHNGDCHERRV